MPFLETMDVHALGNKTRNYLVACVGDRLAKYSFSQNRKILRFILLFPFVLPSKISAFNEHSVSKSQPITIRSQRCCTFCLERAALSSDLASNIKLPASFSASAALNRIVGPPNPDRATFPMVDRGSSTIRPSLG